jgi:hypothetical protein
MLHPAGLGEILGEFFLGHAANFAVVVKQDAAVAGCSCIQCHYIFCHSFLPKHFKRKRANETKAARAAR